MSVVEHYVYRVFWSGEDEAFVGTVAELPSLSWVADTQLAAFEGIQRLAAEVVEDLIADGQSAPEAISDRTYSGKFQVRLTPEQHRRLAADAAEQNVSLNRLIASRLAG